MTDLWNYLKTVNKPIVLYGTGNGADKIVNRLEKDGISLSGVFSSDGFKKGKLFKGLMVSSYEELYKILGDMIILVGFGSSRPEVLENIKTLMQKHELYVPDVPVYGNEIFDIDFARKHKLEIEKAYSLLCDDFSKTVYKNIILFKLSGNPKLLFECESNVNEAYSLLNLNTNECYLDLGAYTGDTAEQFISKVKKYHKIIALEPDSRNYKKLCLNTKNYENCICINAAISDKCGKTKISNQHGRGVSNQGKNILVDTLTIDFIAKKNPPTFIKMDVEGCEDIAINSASKTIAEIKPKMHIACYHRSLDIFSIPLKIKQINPEYKVYIRHHRYLPAWDTNFIFI